MAHSIPEALKHLDETLKVLSDEEIRRCLDLAEIADGRANIAALLARCDERESVALQISDDVERALKRTPEGAGWAGTRAALTEARRCAKERASALAEVRRLIGQKYANAGPGEFALPRRRPGKPSSRSAFVQLVVTTLPRLSTLSPADWAHLGIAVGLDDPAEPFANLKRCYRDLAGPQGRG